MKPTKTTWMALAASTTLALPVAADQVFLDDLIVEGSACVGLDCNNGESFGFDTIRMKENNLRLHFDDTSTSASFPSNDWRIGANDSSNGGENKLFFEDTTGGREVMTLRAGAPANSLYVDAQGDVGMGTSNPIVELHVVDGDSPTLRLEQNGSSGFTPQVFDIASNETNFFVRDVTNGSQLPFRIRPGADSNSLVITADNDVGIGTDTPAGRLHVRAAATDAFTQNAFVVTSDGKVGFGTNAPDEQLHIASASTRTAIELQNSTSATDNFQIAYDNTALRLSRQGSGVIEMNILTGGNVTIAGTLTQNSDRNSKTRIVPVDNTQILEKVRALQIAHWTYKRDAEAGIRHIGPMAQDFHHLFGTGESETGISTVDTSGVALAAIQELTDQNADQAALIKALTKRLDALEAN